MENTAELHSKFFNPLHTEILLNFVPVLNSEFLSWSYIQQKKFDILAKIANEYQSILSFKTDI